MILEGDQGGWLVTVVSLSGWCQGYTVLCGNEMSHMHSQVFWGGKTFRQFFKFLES